MSSLFNHPFVKYVNSNKYETLTNPRFYLHDTDNSTLVAGMTVDPGEKFASMFVVFVGIFQMRLDRRTHGKSYNQPYVIL